jgi:hypothetical protein
MSWFPMTSAFLVNFDAFVYKKLIIIILGIIMTCAEITQHIVMSKGRIISPQHSR